MKNESIASGYELIWPHCLQTGSEGSLRFCLLSVFLSFSPWDTKKEHNILSKALLGALRDVTYIRFVFNSSAGSLFLENVNDGKCQSEIKKRGELVTRFRSLLAPFFFSNAAYNTLQFYFKDIFAFRKGYGTGLLLAAVKENSNSGKLLLSSGP